MKISSYILSAKHALSLYNGTAPFAVWLKQYFKANKKFGSRDRKIITHLCFCFFRLGKAFEKGSVEERIAIGLFLASKEQTKELQEVNASWNNAVHLGVEQKLEMLNGVEESKNIFPFTQFLSNEIEDQAFVFSHLSQPDLHIRVRPGNREIVLQKLKKAAIESKECGAACLALPNGTKLDNVILIDKEAVVQDVSSQQVITPLQSLELASASSLSAWDCCAASGGKSILLKDTFPGIKLTVSDVRSSILQNLHARFQTAGIADYKSFRADVSTPQFTITPQFDIIVCDAPCSGSGTWSRAPENLSFFTEEKLNQYSNLQKWIVVNAAKGIKKGGAFLYITCSVFKLENEEIVAHIQKNTSLCLQQTDYFKGYKRSGDTLFAALFTL